LSESFTDSLEFGPQTADTSYQRFPDGGATWQLTTCYSPNAANCGTTGLTPGVYLPFVQK